jgi:hypothetical protein
MKGMGSTSKAGEVPHTLYLSAVVLCGPVILYWHFFSTRIEAGRCLGMLMPGHAQSVPRSLIASGFSASRDFVCVPDRVSSALIYISFVALQPRLSLFVSSYPLFSQETCRFSLYVKIRDLHSGLLKACDVIQGAECRRTSSTPKQTLKDEYAIGR